MGDAPVEEANGAWRPGGPGQRPVPNEFECLAEGQAQGDSLVYLLFSLFYPVYVCVCACFGLFCVVPLGGVICLALFGVEV